MEEVLEVSNLESRQRKEKKELQAQIQALKKTAKNDKTKKKELILVIARLEKDLDSRHKHEIEAECTEGNENHCENDTSRETESEPEKSKGKVSKAQKRRDKKSQQEKQRLEEIKLQEQANLNGPRNIELQAIHTKVKEKKLNIFLIPSDGDCLYKAIAHQLQTLKHQTVSVNELRYSVAKYIRDHKYDFIPFMSDPDTADMLSDTQFEQYCEKIETTKVWGGQVEIQALSNSLKCPINIIQANGPDVIEQGIEYTGPPLVITYHRHMYSLGEHYNSTTPMDSD